MSLLQCKSGADALEMSLPRFTGDTLDDLLRSVFERLLNFGQRVEASRGGTIELTGASLELTNPRARLSRTEARGKVFSALGELIWYLAGSEALEFIEYYIPKYREEAEDGVLLGAYGPRLIGPPHQIQNAIAQLSRNSSSRRSVIQLFDAADLVGPRKEIPCTCTFQFLIRNGRLDLITHMRSNDAVLGLPHDVFCFTMLQEIIARSLSVELGTYRHMVGSLHIYDTAVDQVGAYLGEGFQSTKHIMPELPVGDPWVAITKFVEIERRIRVNDDPCEDAFSDLPAYWQDLARLLLILRARKANRLEQMRRLRDSMQSAAYLVFVDELVERTVRN